MKRALLGAIVLAAPAARAQSLVQELDVRADEVTVDTRMRELELRGHVHADAPPFHLSADKLDLKRSSRGITVEGDGRLTFCPCLATPIALGFKGATVAPPGDLFLTSPRLEIFHVPVFWLPFFWLRAPDRVGLLPPEIAWRGADGLFVGEGVHLPWGPKKRPSVVDLTAGGYFDGGFAASASARTPDTTTLVRLDYLPESVAPGAAGGGAGLLVDARGALTHDVGPLRARAAWDFDLLRGARGVQATTDLDAASRAFDVGQAELSVDRGFVAASGVRMAAVRGGDLLAADAVGPYVSLGGDGAIGAVGAYDATADASVLHEAAVGSVALAHGEAGVLLAGRPSIFGVSASLRGVADAAADDYDSGATAAALARAEITAPFVRSFDTSDRADPLRHRIEPFVAVSALAQDSAGALADIAARSFAFVGQSAFADESGVAGVASAGLRSNLARWARGDGLELEANAGGLVDPSGEARGALRWRVRAGGQVIGLSAEGAHVLSRDALGTGDAALVRARVGIPIQGRASGPSVAAHVAVREGVDPVAARLLTDAPLEPAAGLFATTGVSGGIRASVPWTRWLTTRGGVDMDLDQLVVTGAVGTIELRDTCGCFRIAVNAAHRLGRDGVDVWTTIDLVPR